MGFKIGGFVCNGCSVFSENDGASYSTTDGTIEYKLPKGWVVTTDQPISDGWIKANGKSLILYCDGCVRSQKIFKIKKEINNDPKNFHNYLYIQ